MTNMSPALTCIGAILSIAIGSEYVSGVFVLISPPSYFRTRCPDGASCGMVILISPELTTVISVISVPSANTTAFTLSIPFPINRMSLPRNAGDGPKTSSCTESSPSVCSSFSQEVKNSPPISKQTSQSVNWCFFILKTVIIVYFRLLWHSSQLIHSNHRVGCRPHIHQSAVGQENIQVVKRLGKYVQRRPCSVVLKLRKWDSNGHPTISLVHTDISPWHPYST